MSPPTARTRCLMVTSISTTPSRHDCHSERCEPQSDRPRRASLVVRRLELRQSVPVPHLHRWIWSVPQNTRQARSGQSQRFGLHHAGQEGRTRRATCLPSDGMLTMCYSGGEYIHVASCDSCLGARSRLVFRHNLRRRGRTCRLIERDPLFFWLPF